MEKKDGKNYEVLKFFETLILFVLIGTAIIIVFEVFSDQMNGDDEYYDDYEYKDYSYDYYDDYYDEYDNYYSDLNNNDNNDSNDNSNTENTSVSNFVSIEDFMNSEEGKKFLEKSNQNLVNSNEIELKNVVEEVVDKEDIYEYYDSQNALKEKFDAQRKKIGIKDEGRSLNNEIMVSIKNNDEDFLYDLTLNTIFFKGDKIASIDVQDINIIDGNNTKYIKVSGIPEEYDNYEFLISKRHHIEYYNELLNDDISFSSERTKDGIKIEVQNKSSKSINRIYFTILYFDNTGKLVDFEEVHKYSVNSNKTPTLYGYGIWDDKNSRRFDFADYEVILDYAENYGY